MPQRQPHSAQRKLAESRRKERARQRRLRLLAGIAGLVALALVAIALIAIIGGRTGTRAGAQGTQPGTHSMAQGATVDGVACQNSEQAAYHIHTHLAVFVAGTARQVPAGIGIPGPRQVQNGFVVGGKCFYWLHTHDATGVIHIESPTQRVYTLGQFFDIWGQPLSGTRVGAASGPVTVFVNGKKFTGDPRAITLTPHKVIQLDVGTVVAPHPFTFPAGL